MYEDLFSAVMMATDQDNRPLHTVFQLLPSKKVREGHCGAYIAQSWCIQMPQGDVVVY
jgi:hypothetical protein